MRSRFSGCRAVCWLGLSLLSAGCSSGGFATSAAPSVEEFALAGSQVTESSGLARSQRDTEMLWTHNDSGGAAALYAIDPRGEMLGSLTVSPAVNVDWEDMASFEQDGAPRLLLADIGDNYAARPFLTLYLIEEPDLVHAPRPFALSTAPLWTLHFRYPDGPRDAESIAVDAQEGFIYVLSKRDAVPRLYRLPLAPASGVVTAEALGEIRIHRAGPDDLQPERVNWVTGMDLDGTARWIAVTSLRQVHLYRREAGQGWREALQQQALTFDLPAYAQIEAVSLTQDGQALWVSSEGSPMPLARLSQGW